MHHRVKSPQRVGVRPDSPSQRSPTRMGSSPIKLPGREASFFGSTHHSPASRLVFVDQRHGQPRTTGSGSPGTPHAAPRSVVIVKPMETRTPSRKAGGVSSPSSPESGSSSASTPMWAPSSPSTFDRQDTTGAFTPTETRDRRSMRNFFLSLSLSKSQALGEAQVATAAVAAAVACVACGRAGGSRSPKTTSRRTSHGTPRRPSPGPGGSPTQPHVTRPDLLRSCTTELQAEVDCLQHLFLRPPAAASPTVPAIQGIGDLLDRLQRGASPGNLAGQPADLPAVSSPFEPEQSVPEECGAVGLEDLHPEPLISSSGSSSAATSPNFPHTTRPPAVPVLFTTSPTITGLNKTKLPAPTAPPSEGHSLDVLSQPLPVHECLTKANSAMLQRGLTFSLLPPDPSSARQKGRRPSSQDTRRRSSSNCSNDRTPRRSSSGSANSQNETEQDRKARLAQEKREEAQQRYSEQLQDRIEKRDTRRQQAVETLLQTRRAMADGMRQAMWRTLLVFAQWRFWDVHRHRSDYDRLRCLFLPVWRRYRYRKHRRILQRFMVGLHARKLCPLQPDQLRGSGKLFAGWPEANLKAFIKKLQPAVFWPRQCICFQGEPSRQLYILVDGKVDVVLRQSGSRSKSRSISAGCVVATLQPVAYFGEYGVFADEPRAGTVVGQGRVLAWSCSKELFVYHLRRLPSAVYREISQQFEANMSKIYQVRPSQLESTVLFRGWELSVLEELVKKLEPMLFPAHSVILHAGAAGTGLYFVCKGWCECTRLSEAGRPISTVLKGAGQQLGVRSCIFPEKQFYEVRAVTTVQAWRLDKVELMGFMLARPAEFLAAKGRVNEEYEAGLERPSLQFLRSLPFFAKFPTPHLSLLADQMAPHVMEPFVTLLKAGTRITAIFVVVHGSCQSGAQRFGVGDTIGTRCIHAGNRLWPADVTTLERVEYWSIALEAMAAVLHRPVGRRGQRKADAPALLKQLQHILS
eukprot:EG_transcript_1683